MLNDDHSGSSLSQVKSSLFMCRSSSSRWELLLLLLLYLSKEGILICPLFCRAFFFLREEETVWGGYLKSEEALGGIFRGDVEGEDNWIRV